MKLNTLNLTWKQTVTTATSIGSVEVSRQSTKHSQRMKNNIRRGKDNGSPLQPKNLDWIQIV